MSKLKEAVARLGRDEVERIAERAGTSVNYLVEQIANGHRRPSIKLARRLAEASGGRLTLQDLRPDVYVETPKGAAA